MQKRNGWGWYGVKVLYENIVSDEPKQEYIDCNYSTEVRTLEESIIVVRAQSFEHAWKIAENKFTKQAEISYENPYGETIKSQLVDIIDTFLLSDDPIESGTEVYSRILHMPKGASNEEIIEQLYPETTETKEAAIRCNYRYRFMEFNGK